MHQSLHDVNELKSIILIFTQQTGLNTQRSADEEEGEEEECRHY